MVANWQDEISFERYRNQTVGGKNHQTKKYGVKGIVTKQFQARNKGKMNMKRFLYEENINEHARG